MRNINKNDFGMYEIKNNPLSVSDWILLILSVILITSFVYIGELIIGTQ